MRKRDLAVVLDYVDRVIAEFSDIGWHILFFREGLTVDNEAFFYSTIVERPFVGQANLGRQFGRTGVFLAVVANFGFDRDAHVSDEKTAIRLPAPRDPPFL